MHMNDLHSTRKTGKATPGSVVVQRATATLVKAGDRAWTKDTAISSTANNWSLQNRGNTIDLEVPKEHSPQRNNNNTHLSSRVLASSIGVPTIGTSTPVTVELLAATGSRRNAPRSDRRVAATSTLAGLESTGGRTTPPPTGAARCTGADVVGATVEATTVDGS